MDQPQTAGATTAPAPNIKWSYMDHWSVLTPRGFVAPQLGPTYLDRFYKAIAGVGFQGIDPFEFRLNALIQHFGSGKKVLEFAQARGIERFVNIFCVFYNDMVHIRENHDGVAAAFEAKLKQYQDIEVDNFIVMPAARYWMVEPVTDEKIKLMGECWNRVGEMTEKHGVHLTCHHEFYCALHHRSELDKFYAWTDPRYVHLFLDTAQHVIAGVDPVDFYMQHRDRVSGFHFKDTHYVDHNDDYRTPPDPERVASTTPRWFWEMGTEGGLVDFPRIMKAMKDFGYKGWASVEHDKADVGGNYAESTCRTKWYIDNVLSKIYA
jgi:inosose dehydratase